MEWPAHLPANRPPCTPTSVGILRLAAQLDDVLRGRALSALHHVELDLVTLGQGLEALSRDRRVMNEAILLSTLRSDEAEALGIVEPLHGSSRTHYLLLMCVL